MIILFDSFCLFELFGYPKLEATEGRKDVVSEDSHSDAENLAAAMAMKCMSSSSTLNIRDKQVKCEYFCQEHPNRPSLMVCLCRFNCSDETAESVL